MRAVTRKERKFLLNLESAKKLEGLLDQVLTQDSHNGPNGYPIRSLYFDTIHEHDFVEKLFGLQLRRKIRMRIYDPKANFALFELKQKDGDNQRKRSLTLTRGEAERIMGGGYDLLLSRPEPLATELYVLLTANGYLPKAIVQYRRKAYVSDVNSTRVTLDSDIRATETNLDLFSENLPLDPVLNPFSVLLEVKWNRFLLSCIRELLDTVDRSETSLSKYSLSRSFTQPYEY